MRTELKSGGKHHYTTGLNAMPRQCASVRIRRKNNAREGSSSPAPDTFLTPAGVVIRVEK